MELEQAVFKGMQIVLQNNLALFTTNPDFYDIRTKAYHNVNIHACRKSLCKMELNVHCQKYMADHYLLLNTKICIVFCNPRKKLAKEMKVRKFDILMIRTLRNILRKRRYSNRSFRTQRSHVRSPAMLTARNLGSYSFAAAEWQHRLRDSTC